MSWWLPLIEGYGSQFILKRQTLVREKLRLIRWEPLVLS